MTQDQQTETLERFKEGRYKVVVCTSVAIEGIDAPDCNIVLNYNFSGDQITKIQMKGRNRCIQHSFLSSPEDNVLKVSFCDGPLSVVHRPSVSPCVNIFLTTSPLKIAYWILTSQK